MENLNLFPARVPIGVTVDANGTERTVTMTPEFCRALSDLLFRVGGPDGVDSQSLALLSSFEPPAPSTAAQEDALALAAQSDSGAAIAALRAEMEALRIEVGALQQLAIVGAQFEDLRAQIGMIEDPGAAVRFLLTTYAPLNSPTFTGIPTAPTAIVDTNTFQLATTAFVLAQAAAAAPLMDGVAAVGISTRYARGDHVHPTDTSRQATIVKGTATGSRGGNAALASLLTALAGSGLVTDSTTA